MSRMTVQQAAEQWGLSVRSVQHLCKEGRIPGAARWGRTWVIPADAQRPADRRRKDRAAPELTLSCRSPVVLMTDLCHKKPAADELTPEDLLLEVWRTYSRGEIERSVCIAKSLSRFRADFYSAVSVGLVQVACALWTGDKELWLKGRERIMTAPGNDSAEQMARELWLATTNEGLLDNSQLPDWFRQGRLEFLPKDSLPSAEFYYAKHLYVSARDVATGGASYPDVEKLGLIRILPHLVEPMIARAQKSGIPMLEICQRCLCAEAYHVLGDLENTVRQLDGALLLALPEKSYGILAEFRSLFGNLMDDRAALIDPEAVKPIRQLHKQMLQGCSKLNYALRNVKIAINLSTREQEVAKLASVGLSNPEIAERLHLSLSSVKSIISTIMNKTGTQRRSEFALHLL